MTIEKLLNIAIEILKKEKIEEPILKAKILLCNTLNVKKEYLLINNNKEVEEKYEKEYLIKIHKLCKGMPIQYITNSQEFMKMHFYVDKNVLIPQADTEIIVESIIEFCSINRNIKYKILDLCTGSGAIGISLAKYIPNCEVLCTDISKDALNIAERNAKENEIYNIRFKQSDLFENIKGKFNIIVSNPPYVKTSIISKLDKEVQNEPHIALDGGKDGLKFYRLIVNQVSSFLEPKGVVFLEIGYDQKNEVTKIVNDTKLFSKIQCKQDLNKNNRMIYFQKDI